MTSRHGRLLYAPFTLVSETHKREKTPTRLRVRLGVRQNQLRVSKPNLVCGWYVPGCTFSVQFSAKSVQEFWSLEWSEINFPLHRPVPYIAGRSYRTRHKIR